MTMRFGAVREDWSDKPCAIVAGGPSLIGFDFAKLQPFHVLAVKASIFDLKFADAGFGLDMPRYMEWVDNNKFAGTTMPIYWAVERNYGPIDQRPQPDNVTFLD